MCSKSPWPLDWVAGDVCSSSDEVSMAAVLTPCCSSPDGFAVLFVNVSAMQNRTIFAQWLSGMATPLDPGVA